MTSVGSTQGIQEQAAAFSSGGFSNIFKRPAYQDDAVAAYLKQLGNTNKGLFNASGRAYPDVSTQGVQFVIEVAGQLQGVDGTSAWVNTMIQTPTPDHVVQLLGAMSQIPTLCDEFTDNFSHPHRNADLLSTPQRVEAAIARHAALGRVPETAGAA